MKQTPEKQWLELLPYSSSFKMTLPLKLFLITFINSIVKRHREITEALLY